MNHFALHRTHSKIQISILCCTSIALAQRPDAHLKHTPPLPLLVPSLEPVLCNTRLGWGAKMVRAAAAWGLCVMGLVLAASWVSTEAVVTVINSALVPVDVVTDGNRVTVKTGATPVYVDVKGSKEETVQVSTGKGKKPIFVDVKDGDTIVIVPDFLGGGTVDVNVNGVYKGHV